MKTITINKRDWILRRDLQDCTYWDSNYISDDGDCVRLYIDKVKDNVGGFQLECFSGIPASQIYIDSVDFGALWRKAKYEMSIQNYSYEEQSVMIADYLCTLFCEWFETKK